MLELRVECYAGYRADQRPLRFFLGEREYEVKQVDDQWYGESAIFFRVRANDGNSYVLCHDEKNDVWSLEAFRAAR